MFSSSKKFRIFYYKFLQIREFYFAWHILNFPRYFIDDLLSGNQLIRSSIKHWYSEKIIVTIVVNRLLHLFLKIFAIYVHKLCTALREMYFKNVTTTYEGIISNAIYACYTCYIKSLTFSSIAGLIRIPRVARFSIIAFWEVINCTTLLLQAKWRWFILLFVPHFIHVVLPTGKCDQFRGGMDFQLDLESNSGRRNFWAPWSGARSFRVESM